VLDAYAVAGDGGQGGFAPLVSPETGTAYTVPAGQRLVVESITGTAEMAPGETPFTMNITFDTNVVQPPNEPPTIFLAPIYTGTAAGTSAFCFASNVTTYVEPGSQLIAAFSRGPSTSGGAILLVTLSGHLEPIT
jgi:hypothetical protein